MSCLNPHHPSSLVSLREVRVHGAENQTQVETNAVLYSRARARLSEVEIKAKARAQIRLD